VLVHITVPLRLLECEFEPNSTPKASSRGEDCPLIYSNLVLFLADTPCTAFVLIYNFIFADKKK